MKALSTTVVAVCVLMASTVSVDAKQKSGKPLKVVILAGQSNMQEPAGWQTLKGLADTESTKSLYGKLVDNDGKVRTFTDIRLANKTNDFPHGFAGQVLGTPKLTGRYGPELGFGVTFQALVDEPVLIIKTAWGGKSLHTNFRPPTGKRWDPPKDHPDHPDNAPPVRKIPTSFKMPADFQKPEGRGKNIQMMTAREFGEHHGVYPLYVMDISEKKEKRWDDIPFQTGDVILGINGKGLGENPVNQWRTTWFNDIREGDWNMDVTYWRDGKIDTVRIDTTQQLADGRDGIAAYVAEKKAVEEELLANGGEYYKMMMQIIKDVLADPAKHHPAYDPKAGVELCGLVWFQGYNDQINGGVYPNGKKPRGFERYSWLLGQFINSVRAELKTPELPFVIGVFGQGGMLDRPDYFREGMAAPADYDEFKATVAAVETAPFWDEKVDEISSRLKRVQAYEGDDPNHSFAKMQEKIRALQASVGDKKLGKGDRRKLAADIMNIVRTPEEGEYLANNQSNQGYHYNGSPKFFVRAGEAFAKALHDLMKDGK